MTTSIRDFSPRDWGQYFSGTQVAYTLKDGSPQVGIIQTFRTGGLLGSKAVIQRTDCTGTDIVPVQDIRWQGTPEPKCVAYRNYLYFVAASGIRTYKKGITGDNMMALRYEAGIGDPLDVAVCGAGQRCNIPEQVIKSVLNPQDNYPTDVSELRDLIGSERRMAIPLSWNTGVLWNGDVFFLYEGGVLTHEFSFTGLSIHLWGDKTKEKKKFKVSPRRVVNTSHDPLQATRLSDAEVSEMVSSAEREWLNQLHQPQGNLDEPDSVRMEVFSRADLSIAQAEFAEDNT